MKLLKVLVLPAIAAMLVTGCASGPRYNEVKASFPPLPAEKGRIFFYRTAVLGAGVQPSVKLNDTPVGSAKPKGFFYVDRPPGDYRVETSTEVSRRLSLTLEAGQTRYVRLNMAMGFFVGHVWPELVENATGELELVGCSFAPDK
ncbi:MAG: DUF2846 domain-containing protein [Verrucomicrobia bacterium]|nr:MAG: DUF2846 domain-containing protein [Verrucomicrobiota bacterium]